MKRTMNAIVKRSTTLKMEETTIVVNRLATGLCCLIQESTKSSAANIDFDNKYQSGRSYNSLI